MMPSVPFHGIHMLPNNSLMLTRLAGEKARAPCLPPGWRENGSQPGSPGSIARGR